MAAVAALLTALARLVARDLATFQTLAGNNIFAFVLFLTAMQPAATSVFLLIFGALIFLLSSEDPIRKVPPERLQLWPLSTTQRYAAHIGALALSPVIWVGVVLGIVTHRWRESLILVSATVIIQVFYLLFSKLHHRQPSLDLRLLIPALPGAFGGFVTLHFREMLLLLDTYVAVILTLAAHAYVHFTPHPDRTALSVVAMLSSLSLSTHAQNLMGLDGADARTRYRLFALPGWRVLLPKDTAYLLMTLLLTITTNPLIGLTTAFAALAIGHQRSAAEPVLQRRWRFAGGRLVMPGIFQIGAVFMFGTNLMNNFHPIWIIGALMAWLVSLWYFGRTLDTQANR